MLNPVTRSLAQSPDLLPSHVCACAFAHSCPPATVATGAGSAVVGERASIPGRQTLSIHNHHPSQQYVAGTSLTLCSNAAAASAHSPKSSQHIIQFVHTRYHGPACSSGRKQRTTHNQGHPCQTPTAHIPSAKCLRTPHQLCSADKEKQAQR